ncbi:MAG: hypothetical protein INF91_08625 [Alphaproteobacteria bacterium]|nr:hypothetical protein [Alphaproteobacteria bacterium]
MAEAAHDVCSLTLVRRVAALLDRDPFAWEEGFALPRGWEFILFTPVTPQSQLRPDGHHYRDVNGPDGVPTKVVLGGRRVRYEGGIPIGARVTRTSEIAGEALKDGGRLRIVTRRHKTYIAGGSKPVIVEDEDMIYRPATPAAAPAKAAALKPLPDGPRRPFRTDETMLFRYSVLTNNAHRIHYDAPFAREVEGYPAPVINGGLTALMLVETFRTEAGRTPSSVVTRMMRPLFCGDANRIGWTAGGDGEWRIWAETPAGELAAEARIA